MAAPNMNGRLHLTGFHQNSPASLENYKEIMPNHLKNQKWPILLGQTSILRGGK